MSAFPAIVATEPGPATLQELTDDQLPDGDVTVAVQWSSLNYKDGLAVTGKGKIIRSFPMVCGIDLAGTVEASDSPSWQVGDEVVVTGWGLSETAPGGFTQRQRLRSEWLVRQPDARDGARADALRRRRRCVRPGRRQRPADDCAAVHPPRGQPARCRLGDVPDTPADRGLAAPRPRPAGRATGGAHDGRTDDARDAARRGHTGRT